MEPNTNANKYDVRPLRTRSKRYRKLLGALLAAFLLGGVGIPLGVEQFHSWKRSVALQLIQDELSRLPIDSNNKDSRTLGLKLAQCQGQLDDFANRLATIGAAVDLSD